MVVITYKHNIENYQNIELKLQDFIIPSLDKADGDEGDDGDRGAKGGVGPQGPHGKLPLNVLKETKLTWQAGYGINDLISSDNPKRKEVVDKFVDKIFKDVLELIKKDENQEHKNFIVRSQNLANEVDTFNVIRQTLPAISEQKKFIKPYLIVAQYSATLYEQVPNGWQVCDGNNLRYSNTGENLPVKTPDLRGRFIAGGNKNDIKKNNFDGNYYGSTFVKLTINQIPSHSHTFVESKWDYEDYTCEHSDHFARETGHSILRWVGTGINTETSTVGGNQPHNNMPPFYILRYIIKQPSK